MIAVDLVLGDQRGDQRLVAGVADDQRHAFGIAQSKPVERLSSTTTALAGVGQRVHHVAADIAGAAGHQNCHVPRPVPAG